MVYGLNGVNECHFGVRMNLRHNDIEGAFKSAGHTLLSAFYINNRTKLKARCPQGDIYEIRWGNFQQGQRCPLCSNRKKSQNKLLSPILVKEYVEKEGYHLCSKYSSAKEKMWFMCPNKHVYESTWDSFKSGHRCRICSLEKGRQFKRSKILAKMSNFLEKEGIVVYNHKYEHHKTKFWALCPQGHKFETCWKYLQRGIKCPVCSKETTISYGEKRLGEILHTIFPGEVIKSQDNMVFLKKQKVDFSIRRLSLAFEYDGIQHYQPITFGIFDNKQAEINFEEQKERDRRKDILCKCNNIVLIRFRYNEEMTIKSVFKRIPKGACYASVW